MTGTHCQTTWRKHGMCTASSAYTGVPGRQQAPLDVWTSEGQAERPAHHPDILTMAPQGPQRITPQVSKSQLSSSSKHWISKIISCFEIILAFHVRMHTVTLQSVSRTLQYCIPRPLYWRLENNSHCLILPRPIQQNSCFPTEIAQFLIKKILISLG